MALLKSCCCWSNVRNGTIACGVYTLIISMIYSCMIGYNIGHLRDHFVITSQVAVVNGWFLATLVMCVLLFSSSVLLVVGIHQDNRYMLMPWIVTTVVMVLVDTAALIYQCVVVGMLYYHIVQMAMWLALTLLNLYCVLCVISQVLELKAGRGTLEYLRQSSGHIIYHSGVHEVHIRHGPLMMTCSAGTTVLAPLPHCALPRDAAPSPPAYNLILNQPPQFTDMSTDDASRQQPLLWSKAPPPYCP